MTRSLTLMIRSLRLLTVVAVLVALVVPAASLGAPRAKGTDRGVIQSVDSSQIVLRALDGGVVSFAVSPRTVVRLNGARAAVAEIHPGYVARVVHDANARALVIEAFGGPVATIDRGVVTAITRSTITVRLTGGPIVTFALDAGTRFRLQGAPSRRQLARPGARVAVTHASDAPATVVNVLKRAGA
jgi:hypothetical protein